MYSVNTTKTNNATYAYLQNLCSHTPSDSIPADTHTSSDCIPADSPPTSMGGHLTPESPFPKASCSAMNPQGVNTIYLPKMVLSLLTNPPTKSNSNIGLRSSLTCTSLVIADTGATDHMLPDKYAFISYYPVTGRQVRMGNTSFAIINGYGTAGISLNGKKILIHDCLQVPDLHNPLYSLWAHQRQ